MNDKPLDLDAIRALTDAATPGPWWAWDRGVGWVIAVGEPASDGYPADRLPEGLRTDIGKRADAEFIAHARQDMPALLDEIAEDRRLFAKYVGELHSALLDVEQLTSERDALAGAIRALVEHEDDPCILDHNGYCQGHNLSRPCSVAAARRLLGLDGA